MDKNKLNEQVANVCLDWMLDNEGYSYTIGLLINKGFTDKEILSLGFDKEDIDNAREDLEDFTYPTQEEQC